MKTHEGWAGCRRHRQRDAGATKTGVPRLTTIDHPSDRSVGVPPPVAATSRPRSPLWATLVGTFFGVGHLRPGPGTWGSAATVLLWWLLGRWITPGWQP